MAVQLVYRVTEEKLLAPGRWLVAFDVFDAAAGAAIIKGVRHVFQRLTAVGVTPIRWAVVGAPPGSGFEPATGYTMTGSAAAYHEVLVAFVAWAAEYNGSIAAASSSASTVPVGAFVDASILTTPTTITPTSLQGQ